MVTGNVKLGGVRVEADVNTLGLNIILPIHCF